MSPRIRSFHTGVKYEARERQKSLCVEGSENAENKRLKRVILDQFYKATNGHEINKTTQKDVRTF